MEAGADRKCFQIVAKSRAYPETEFRKFSHSDANLFLQFFDVGELTANVFEGFCFSDSTRKSLAIIKQSDKFLLTKRSDSKKNAAGYWASVGGRLEDGESLEVGLVPECLEEIGVDVKAIKQIMQLIEKDAAHFWFEVEIISGIPKLTNDEHSDLQWFTKSEADLLSPIVVEDLNLIHLYGVASIKDAINHPEDR